MKEIYDWVPWFRELARKIADRGEIYLIEKAKQVDWVKERPALLQYGDKNIDPFSFFYFLASKSTSKQQPPVYGSVRDVFEIQNPLPDTYIADHYTFPIPPSHVPALFHNGRNFEPDLLWRLFNQAAYDDPIIDRDSFQKVLDIDGVGVTKLTQTLFLINPGYFLPIDDTTKAIPALQSDIEKKIRDGGYEEYRRALDMLKGTFPGCRPCEINMFLFLWLQQKKRGINAGSNFFQVSTKAHGDKEPDHWENFKENNYVYTGGPGSEKSWGEKGKYPLTQAERGDIILVRTGEKQGRAIGIVQKNDYAEKDGLNEDSRIHVLWINKSERELSEKMGRLPGFTLIDSTYKVFQVFERTKGFAPTFDLIKRLSKNNPEPEPDDQPSKVDTMNVSDALNQILYGPPGTGKTWSTANYALAIIEGKSLDKLEHEGRQKVKRRFDKLKEGGRIAMVTFHQNFAYEDFIEGIRPVLDDNSENLRYKLSPGVFKEIAERAHDNSQEKYVLIIDEINRGNIAKIFGELITLLEESKRLGGGDETTVTLPYSKKEFGVPNNLYIIGTMNTADRSIALLDTALRRRFEFIEMMPDSSHDGIGTDIEGVHCRELLAAMNKRIHFLLDREHQIGHTYFIDDDNVNNIDFLSKAFKNKIIPLLQEYFYDNWEKIDLVLNKNGFVRKIEIPEDLGKSDLVDNTRGVYELLPVTNDKWKDPKSYQAIYEEKQGEADKTEQAT